MSHSPVEANRRQTQRTYVEGWGALHRMIAEGQSWSGRERNCCFLNTGTSQFANVSAITGLDFADDGRAIASVDWDRDGDLDLWISNRSAPCIRYMENNLKTGSHWLSVHLTGKKCIRDAIGARVEVWLPNESRHGVKSLRAGEGFLAQSSKRLHFGLRDADRIEKIVIRWPSGERETFIAQDVDCHYLLTQGTGIARPLRITRPVDLDSVVSEESSATTTPDSGGRVVLYRSRYPDAEAILSTIDVPADSGDRRPRLVTLWASWCGVCREEFRELSDEADHVRRAGLDVLAVNIDHLGGDHVDGSGDDVLAATGFSFETAEATADTLTAVRDLELNITGRAPGLVTPTSFLIDQRNTVRVLYRGRVSVEQVLDDLQLLNAPSEVVRDASAALPGRWRQDLGTMYRDEVTTFALLTVVGDNPLPTVASAGTVAALLGLVVVLRRRRRQTMSQSTTSPAVDSHTE